MFGYIVVNQGEMKFKEYDVYRSFYCGVCRDLKESYGYKGQITLTYDMTFLALLLTGVYEPETICTQERCVVHPFRWHQARRNPFTAYAADMNLLLSYEKCKDDWADERKLSRRAMAGLLKKADSKIAEKYAKKVQRIEACLQAIYAAEKENELDIDRMAGYYGEVMAEIFAYREDMWEQILRKMGFYMGKFVYLMDAFEDVEEDIRRKRYNPLKPLYEDREDLFHHHCKQILTMMMAECSREFEKLPILEHTEILRNILYSGVWLRYHQVVAKRMEQQEKKDA